MRILIQLTILYLFSSPQVFAQSSRTITYHHFYQIRQFQNKQAYSVEAYGALYIQNDTLSIYRLSREEKDLANKFDLSSKESHHAFVRPLTTMKGYEVVNTSNEHIFIERTSDTSKWEILSDRDTILNIPCIAAFKDSTLAWYAPSMPLPAGPFGVAGLPGTILKIYDLKYQYLVEATAFIDTIPAINCSKRMLYMTDVMYRKRQEGLRDSEARKKVKWFWQR